MWKHRAGGCVSVGPVGMGCRAGVNRGVGPVNAG
jgi:hypothetical protein